MKNQERLRELLLEIKGERTIRGWANDTGVSPSTLSNYINDKVRGSITPQTLRKLVDPTTGPRGNVTFEELLAAGGFDELKYSDRMIDYAFFQRTGENETEPPLFILEQQQKKENNMRIMRMLIESEAALSNGEYEVIQDEKYEERFQYVTLKVNNNTRIKKWIIVLDDFKLPFVQMGLSASKFGRLLYINPEEALKVSLFTSDRLFYEQFYRERPKLAYKYDFSIIWFDSYNVSASEDLYLAYTEESDQFDLFS